MLDAHLAGAILRLTLNRPETRNALSAAMMRALADGLETAAADPAIRVVVIAGAGPAFCAGHDLRELRAQNDRAAAAALFQQCAALMQQIVNLPKPVIARVHGIATAAGCQLAASCDLAVAASDARFATPGVRIGLFCTTPAVALSRAIGRQAALGMLLTGEPIDAERAHAIGLVHEIVPPAELDEAVDRLAGALATRSPRILALGKQAFLRQTEMPLAEAYAFASEVMADNLMTADAAEGIDAFLQKRARV